MKLVWRVKKKHKTFRCSILCIFSAEENLWKKYFIFSPINLQENTKNALNWLFLVIFRNMEKLTIFQQIYNICYKNKFDLIFHLQSQPKTSSKITIFIHFLAIFKALETSFKSIEKLSNFQQMFLMTYVGFLWVALSYCKVMVPVVTICLMSNFAIYKQILGGFWKLKYN